ncbi:MAG: single-stranded-DNA-specific exonuclease RecJ [Chloroflexi bacterium]|nr:single-stranded-DNA-specific exonuclease RecJ [Chloroflexota bacterium]MBT7080375.1 single-stranded-DNA-specific exonuclease RecJ [Chloroflexota bacterium]MBT7289813.1 single-stranded-DNA-specific exonuclease RecJ [Chloroflexota bacterium]
MKRKRWQIMPSIPADKKDAWSDYPPLLAQLLYNRDALVDPQSFLDAGASLCHDPFSLPDMDRAVERINLAIDRGQKIVIYGDFDSDGVTSTVLLVQGLGSLGAHVFPYIPHRVEEGYGLNYDALDRLIDDGADLVITADCGVTAIDEVEHANNKGLDIVITDHHTVPDVLPAAVAVVDAKRNDSDYPFAELAGVGVAYKLLCAVFLSHGRDIDEADQFLDLVALGTVADLVPLLDENRYLVKRGLQILSSTRRPGFVELIKKGGLAGGQIDSEGIAFYLAPRINAAARLEHAMSSYNLLNTDSPKDAVVIAQALEATNKERQRLTGEVLEDAIDKLMISGMDDSLLMVGGPDYSSGIVGIVAGRLCDEFYRPAIVYQEIEDECVGSARSIDEFNVVAALTQCADLFSKYGGHPRAAGFTIATKDINVLKSRLLDIADQQLSGLELFPYISIDAEITLSEVDGNTHNVIQLLAPFGMANPAPIFLSRGVSVLDYRKMGANGDHVRFKLADSVGGGAIWDAVGFNLGQSADITSSHLDIVYSLRISRWKGNEVLELNLLDFVSASLL